ncbi:MAG: ribonuclease P protein component 1 [Methanobacteriota archaeon]
MAHRELIGLPARVLDATDPTLVGLAGRVVDETRNTLVLETDRGERRIAKAIAVFEFETEGGRETVRGDEIAQRPEDRTKGTR